MKKLIPATFLFLLVFSGAVAIQVVASEIKQNAKEKSKSANEKVEKFFQDIELETIEGKKLNFKDIKTPIVIVNFWASWCMPCMEEMPSLLALKNKFKNEVTVISLNTDEKDQFKNIVKTKTKFSIKNEFEFIPDKETKMADANNISAIPVSIIFKHGKVVQLTNGPIDFMAQEFTEKIHKWTTP